MNVDVIKKFKGFLKEGANKKYLKSVIVLFFCTVYFKEDYIHQLHATVYILFLYFFWPKPEEWHVCKQ